MHNFNALFNRSQCKFYVLTVDGGAIALFYTQAEHSIDLSVSFMSQLYMMMPTI